ncbi:unnamed protein product [Prorocentrum cordatum]|uniref:ATPase dynein-related AAA domain-containing protein n=1 Tax=Prorocentrum cordatum TaxID=2364126 RepID=A0ABN9TGI0_9DINO|nr:unnamed protein product [Polarella glacialis]
MLRKDAIQQDCFLTGPPGPRRRRLVLGWCELLGREVEYLALSRDTTESDLKQRREIVRGSLEWVDQPPVRAAREGRVLILDGLEKAERNVLPTLNNLLENREMSLQDGTFLTSPERFDALRGPGGADEARLVRVHQDFRVVALGLPVPAFPGFPLDPPLRSRFQARYMAPAPLELLLARLKGRYPGVPAEAVERLAAFSAAVAQMSQPGAEAPGPRPWPLPEDALDAACHAAARFPAGRAGDALHTVYPHDLQGPEPAKTCRDALVCLGLLPAASARPAGYLLAGVRRLAGGAELEVTLSPCAGDGAAEVRACAPGGGAEPLLEAQAPLVDTPTHAGLLSQAVQCAMLGRSVCLVGPGGEGKSALARRLACVLGYPAARVHTLHVYKDMTSRDLFQRRGTDERGDTHWDPSPLLVAALTGGLCVLDGLQRLRPDTTAALQTLCADRDVDLPDGTRLCEHRRFAAACARAGGEGEPPSRLAVGRGRWLRPIHPAFRLVALALPPGRRPAEQWLPAARLPCLRQ